MHTKALGGIFVIDDFGRQTRGPQEFLNRWIVPLEKGVDYFSLHTGQKFEVPFDQLVIFSTNLLPEEIGDGASLRRIYFKIFVPSPTKDDYVKIFEDACAERGLAFDAELIERFYDDNYERPGHVTSGAHPGFLLSHIRAASVFRGVEPALSADILSLAWRNVAATRKRMTPPGQ